MGIFDVSLKAVIGQLLKDRNVLNIFVCLPQDSTRHLAFECRSEWIRGAMNVACSKPFEHARHALIDRTFRSRSIDRPAWFWRWSTGTTLIVLRAFAATGTIRPGKKSANISGFFTVSLTSRRGGLSHISLTLCVDLLQRSTFFVSMCETNITCGL